MRKLSCGIAMMLVLGLLACQDTTLGPDPSPDDISTARKTPKPEPPADDGGGATIAPTIVFSEMDRRAGPLLYFMDTDGNRGQVMADGEHVQGSNPRWAPDGTQFVYHREVVSRKAPTEFWIMMATLDTGTDSWSVERIRTDASWASNPDWSSSGWILYNVAGDLWTVRPDGSGDTRLTFDGDVTENTIWSRDGSRILAHVHDGTGWSLRLYTVDCSGGACVQDGTPTGISLTDLGLEPTDDAAPLDWAHDSDRVLCAMGTSSGWDVGILDLTDPDNPYLGNLTSSPESGESQGAWSPDGQIVHNRFTFDRAPEQLLVRDLADGALSAFVDTDGALFGVDWNPAPGGQP